MTGEPKLWSDTTGIWRQDPDKEPFGIEWGEVCRICGYQLGIRGNSSTHIELIFEFGSAVEIDSTWEGYDEVMKALLERFSINPEELDRIDNHDPDDEFKYFELWSVSADEAATDPNKSSH